MLWPTFFGIALVLGCAATTFCLMKEIEEEVETEKKKESEKYAENNQDVFIP